jgi:hypothetical protein
MGGEAAKNRDVLLDLEVERLAKICSVVTAAWRSTRSGSGADSTFNDEATSRFFCIDSACAG